MQGSGMDPEIEHNYDNKEAKLQRNSTTYGRIPGNFFLSGRYFLQVATSQETFDWTFFNKAQWLSQVIWQDCHTKIALCMKMEILLNEGFIFHLDIFQ